MFKNKLISIGGFLITASPIITVVSCGIDSPSNVERALEKKWKSSEGLKLLTEGYKNKLIKTFTSDFQINDPSATSEYKDDLKFIILNEILKDRQFLVNKRDVIAKQDAFISSLTGTDTAETKLNEWLFLSHSFTQTLSTNDISDPMVSYLGKYDESLREKLFKFIISKKYLNESINKETYKKTLLNENESIYGTPTLIDDAATNFHVIKKALDLRLATTWKLSLEVPGIKSVDKNITEKTATDLINILKTTTGNTIGAKINKHDPITSLRKPILAWYPSGVISSDEINMLGFKGNVAIDSELTIDTSSIKEFTEKGKWNGFIFDEKLIPSTSNDSKKKIDYMKDNSTFKTQYINSIMPIFSSNKLTFKGTDYPPETNGKSNIKLINILVQNSSSTYEEAITYYTKRETNPILLIVNHKGIREYAIKQGLKFIKES